MAGLELHKVQGQAQDVSLPTPLRRRGRTTSVGPDTTEPLRGLASGGATSAAQTAGAAQRAQAPKGRSVAQKAGGLLLVLAGLVCLLLNLPPAPVEEVAGEPRSSRAHSPAPTPLLERVATALICPGPRADIVDILAGAPYEFDRQGAVIDDASMAQNSQTVFERLPQLVQRVMKEKDIVGVTRAETELQETVLQLAATGGNWPGALRHRLLAALDGPCKVVCSSATGLSEGRADALVLPADATKLTVDSAFTSPGTVSAKSGWLHRAMLNLGASTGIPVFRKRAEMYKSRPSSVVVSTDPISPRDCLALRGNASVALRVDSASGSAMIRQVVIEQLPHWVAPKLWSLPGRFEVWGEPEESTGAVNPYTVPLGSFDYVAAAPASQSFTLRNPVRVRGLRLSFKETAHNDAQSFFCIYRLRAFESAQSSCTDSTTKTPARLVVPL